MTLPTVSTVSIFWPTIHLSTASFSFSDLSSSLLLNQVNRVIVLIRDLDLDIFLSTSFLMSNCMSTFALESGRISEIWNVLLSPVLLFLYCTTIIEMAGSSVFGMSIGGFVSLLIVSSVSFA